MAERDQSCRLAPSGECKRNIIAMRWVSLEFGRTGLSNMHRCCASPFALAGLFLLVYAPD